MLRLDSHTRSKQAAQGPYARSEMRRHQERDETPYGLMFEEAL